jgi:uncharacterized protein
VTALHLLAYISTALLLQVTVGIAILVWRRSTREPAAPAIDAPKVGKSDDGAWPGWRDFRVVRREFEDAGRSQCSFYLQPVDGAPLPAFRPGQYLTFTLQVGDGAKSTAGTERRLTRCYSLSDRPEAAYYRITVKRVPAPAGRRELPPGASSNHFLDRVNQDDILKVRAPAGRFCIDPDASVPVVLLAGGIGITPMMSMLRWCVAEQPGREVHLFYGVRSSADHAFKTELEELVRSHPAFKLHVIYSRPESGDVPGRDYQHLGHLDLDLLRRSLPHGGHQFYVCGPPSMMQSLLAALREWGVAQRDIHAEAFGPASLSPAGTNAGEASTVSPALIDVHFQRSGRTLVWDGQDANLLDFAERHGVVVDSGCRSGSCGTCETRIVSGAVHYAGRPDHEIASGYCLPCVGRPQSALVLEA